MIKSLGMSRPVALDLCYTPITVFDAVTHHYFESVNRLESLYQQRDGRSQRRLFDQRDPNERLEGLYVANQEPFLMILGRPGMGKTTLLKRLGMAALRGKGVEGFDHDCLPVFIELRVFRDQELNLEQQIIHELDICGYPSPEDRIQSLLSQGRLLLLLDGLDEVLPEQINLVIDHIRDFVDKHSLNRFVVSCRTTAYQNALNRFTSVVISEFDEEQAQQFTTQWFRDQPTKADQCWQAIQSNEAARTFTYSPLLLVMLFLIFEERTTFPTKKALLYEKGLQILLSDWNREKHGWKNDLLNTRSRELLLAELAFNGARKGQIFFSRKSLIRQIESLMIKNVPESAHIDSLDVLNNIESQYGILVESSKDQFRFAHLSFQEFLTTVSIVDKEDPVLLDEVVKAHLVDPTWGEIWVLLTELMDEPVDLFCVMEKRAQRFLTPKLKTFVRWCDYHSAENTASDCESATKRASTLYFILVLLNLVYRASTSQVFLPVALSLAYLLSLELGMSLDVRMVCDIGSDINSLLEIDDHDRSVFAKALSTLLERELSVCFEIIQMIDMAFDRKVEQQIYYEKERYRDLHICLAFAQEFQRLELCIPEFVSQVIQALRKLEKHLPSANGTEGEHCIYVSEVMRSYQQDLGIPFDILSLEQHDISALESYLITHRIMHKCYKVNYQSPTLLWQRINNHMILPPQN